MYCVSGKLKKKVQRLQKSTTGWGGKVDKKNSMWQSAMETYWVNPNAHEACDITQASAEGTKNSNQAKTSDICAAIRSRTVSRINTWNKHKRLNCRTRHFANVIQVYSALSRCIQLWLRVSGLQASKQMYILLSFYTLTSILALRWTNFLFFSTVFIVVIDCTLE